MSSPASKRRRLDNKNVLLKPFKSPMKTPSPEKEPHRMDHEDSSRNALDANTNDRNIVINPGMMIVQNKQPNTKQAPRFWPPIPPRTSKINGNITLMDPTIKTQLSVLRREESRLSSTLSKLKTELAQISQARSIESSDRDQELSSLVTLWRSASQSVAEEVYSVMREKVNSLGGIRRWRNMEKERRERFNVWNEEDDRAGTGEGEDSEDDNDSSGDVHTADERAECTGLGGKLQEKEEAEGEDEETFSMDVMLKYLGLKCDIIGYDCDTQQWIA